MHPFSASPAPCQVPKFEKAGQKGEFDDIYNNFRIRKHLDLVHLEIISGWEILC